MITNSIKYAFKDSPRNAKIRIQLKQSNSGFILSYQDNGVGIANHPETDSFGMELIRTVIDQIDGKLDHVKDQDWNTHIRIKFK